MRSAAPYRIARVFMSVDLELFREACHARRYLPIRVNQIDVVVEQLIAVERLVGRVAVAD